MTYFKVGPFANGAPPALNETNLNKLDQGIYDAHVLAGLSNDFVKNVKHPDFNAAGNDIQDDTAAIQAATNACIASGGGIVLFPPGIYRTSATLTVPSDNVRWVGTGVSSAIRYIGTNTAVRFGEQDTGNAVLNTAFCDLRIIGTSAASVGLEWVGVQRSVIGGNWRIEGFTGTNAIGLLFITQTNNLAAPVNTIANKIYGGDITNVTHGYVSTKATGVTATWGPSHNNFYGLRCSSFSGIGCNNDWGENNAYYGIDVSTSIDGTTGVRLNDQVCGFYQTRADNSSGEGNTAIGWDVTSSANGFTINMPTGDGTTTWMRFGNAPFEPIQSRIQIGTNPPYGNVDRQAVNYQVGNFRRAFTAIGQDFWTARPWKNNSPSNIATGEVCVMDPAEEGAVLRLNAANHGPRPMVAVELISSGRMGGVAVSGSVCTVQADTGAIAIGDTLVASVTANARVRTDNTETNPRKIVGYARTAKVAGSNGTVKAMIA